MYRCTTVLNDRDILPVQKFITAQTLFKADNEIITVYSNLLLPRDVAKSRLPVNFTA